MNLQRFQPTEGATLDNFSPALDLALMGRDPNWGTANVRLLEDTVRAPYGRHPFGHRYSQARAANE